MAARRREPRPLWITLVVLLLLHFYVVPRVYGGVGAPDFLMVGLMVLALRSRPGIGAVAGFVTGLVMDVLVPARFGAAALAYTVVGYGASWGRSVFFPDNPMVNGVMFGAGVLLRNLLILLASGAGVVGSLRAFYPASLAQALTTALAGILVTLAVRHRVDFRLEG